MKINPINSNNIMPMASANKKQVTFKSGIEQDTFEKTTDIEDKQRMLNIENYKKLRNEFGEKLEKAMYNAELTAWDFYTNSTGENMHKYSHAQEKMHELYKNEKLYKQLKEIKEAGLGDAHLDKQVKDLVRALYDEIESGAEMKALRDKENEISNKYNSYVMTIDGKKTTKAEILKILETETNPEIRRKAYEANVKAGDVIADDLVELVK
jgi:hypothetical protein